MAFRGVGNLYEHYVFWNKLWSDVVLIQCSLCEGLNAVHLCEVVTQLDEQLRRLEYFHLQLSDNTVFNINDDACYVSEKLFWVALSGTQEDCYGLGVLRRLV